MGKGEVKYRITADSKPFQDAFGAASKEFDKFNKGILENAGALGKIAEAAGPLGMALGVAAGAGAAAFGALGVAIAGAVKGLVETGGHLADLSAKTGISTQALQKLAYAGSLVGVSQEEITGAAVKMEKALANGDAVFGKLGLSVQKLRAMKPDEAFAAIAAQIAKIKDPAGQAAAAMEAFGKSGATLLPLIKSDLAGATAEAERLGIVLSDETVRAADALGDEATKLAAAWEGVKNQFAAAIIQNPALLSGLHSLVEVMGDLAQWMVKNRGAISAVVDILIGTGRSAVEGFKQLASWAGAAGSKLKYLVDLVPGLRSMVNVARDIGTYLSMKNIEGSGLTSSASVGGGGAGLVFNGKADTEALKKQNDEKLRIQKIAEDTMAKIRVDAVKTVNAMLDAEYKRGVKVVQFALDEWVEEEKLTAAAIKAIRDDLQKDGDAFMQSWAKQQEEDARALQEKVAGYRALAGALGELGDEIGGAAGALVNFASGGLSALANLNDEALQAASIWQKLTVAIEGAIDAYHAGQKAGSPGKGALAGAGKGAAAGAAFGPYGMVIGAVAGAAIGFFGGKKAQKEEITELRGELARLQAEAARAGVVLARTFDPKSPQQYRNAIAEINKALDTQAEAQQKLQDALGRYNFTLAETGPILAAQELDKQFAQIYQDYQLLTAAGVDHNAILREMGPNVGHYVEAAAAAGVEIPAAMKPIIDDLYKHGQLLHDNGEAYTDAEYQGITYAQTMSQMFQELIAKVGELVNALLGIPNTTSTHTVVTRHTSDGGGDEGDGGETETPAERRRRINGYASGGYIPATPGGKVIRVAEGGQGEWVLNQQQMAAMAGSPEALAELRQMNANLRRLPGIIATATRDAVQMGR